MTPSDAAQNLERDREQARQRILAMEPGLDLDCEVAEHVFGWERKDPAYAGPEPFPEPLFITPEGRLRLRSEIPPYSTDVAAAMAVCERFGGYSIATFPVNIRPYRVQLHWAPPADIWVYAETLPLAVARCALLAVLEAGRP